jgi:hypothetical protein
MNLRSLLVILVSATVALAACGKSSDQAARERAAREASMQKALANSIAEEREKDRRMRAGATEQANDRLAREAAAHEIDVARAAAADRLRPNVEQKQVERATALRKYTDKLMQALPEPATAQIRNAELSPKQNGMCAEFNAKNRSGVFPGFKRVVVTDLRISAEEPPTRETITQFLVFQIAARDTGCFPDVEKVRVLQ